jgi:hypothetical protein
MARPVAYPHGAWPREMSAELAAGYCSEPSVDAFLAKVPKIYPEPTRAPGVQPKWHRLKLDQAIDRRHGLRSDGPLVEDLEALI